LEAYTPRTIVDAPDVANSAIGGYVGSASAAVENRIVAVGREVAGTTGTARSTCGLPPNLIAFR